MMPPSVAYPCGSPAMKESLHNDQAKSAHDEHEGLVPLMASPFFDDNISIEEVINKYGSNIRYLPLKGGVDQNPADR